MNQLAENTGYVEVHTRERESEEVRRRIGYLSWTVLDNCVERKLVTTCTCIPNKVDRSLPLFIDPSYPQLLQIAMGTEFCNNCSALMETKDLKRCADCK